MDPNKEKMPIDTEYDVALDDDIDDVDVDDGSELLVEDVEEEIEDVEEVEEGEEADGESEETDDEEADDEEAADEEAADEEAADEEAEKAEKEEEPLQKNVRIPKRRLDEEIQKRKEAQEEIERLRAQMNQTGTQQQQSQVQQIQQRVAEIDEELSNAMLEGDAAKLKELRQEERYLLNQANQITMVTETARMHSEIKYDETVERVLEKYPFLDDQGKQADFEAIKEVNRLREAFEARGEPPAVALLEAVKYATPQYMSAENEVEEPPPSIKPKAKKTTNVSKNRRAAKAQPPNPANRRSAETAPRKLDVFSMSDDELESLSPEELAKLDGSLI